LRLSNSCRDVQRALLPHSRGRASSLSLLPGTSVVAKVNNAPNLFGYGDNETETTIEIIVSNTTTARFTRCKYYTLPRHTYTAHMARLNEPPIAPQPSAETIDAREDAWNVGAARLELMRCVVKRRFLRQNRELAKCV
jgi:hypothetical protein